VVEIAAAMLLVVLLALEWQARPRAVATPAEPGGAAPGTLPA
jgi:hypothetical protein